MDSASLFDSAELVPGSLLDSALETVHTTYGSPAGLDYHLSESPPLVFLAFAPDQLSDGELLTPPAISEEPAENLNLSLQSQLKFENYTVIDSVTGCPIEVDNIPAAELTFPSPADPSIADSGDQLCINPDLKPVWIGNMVNDSIENFQLEISAASENPEGLQAFDASTNEIRLNDTYSGPSNFQEETVLADNQSDSESLYTQADESLAADIDCAPILPDYDAELSPRIRYAYNSNPQLTFEVDPIPGTSDVQEIQAIGHDYSVIYAEPADNSPVSLTGEKPDSVDSFAEVLPWDGSDKEPEIAICELEIALYSQSILPTERSVDLAEKSIELPQEFPEVPAEILPGEESSEGTTLGTEDILTAEPCLQYPIDSVNSEYDDQFSINPQWPEPFLIDGELDHSPEVIQLESSDSRVDSEISDLLIEVFDASLPIMADSISIDLPSIDGPQLTEDFLEGNSPSNEWGQIPKIMICFLPDFDNSGLAPQPYDASTIDVVSEEADVAIMQDPMDTFTPSRGDTTTPLPWWRGYAASSPENLSSQLLVPEEAVENSDQAQPSPDSILDSCNPGQAQPSPDYILDSDNPILPIAISVTAQPENTIPVAATLRNPKPAPKDAAQGEVFLQPYRYMAHPFAFETTAPDPSSSVEPQLFIDETTSTDTDLQDQSRSSSDDIVDLILSFNNMGSSGFTSPLLWLGPTRLTNLLDLPPWLVF